MFCVLKRYLIPVLAGTVVSCTREELPGPEVMHPVESTVAEPVDYLPVYEQRDAVLAAIANYEYDTSGGAVTEQITGSARAVFPDAGGHYLGVGDVQSQDVSLAVQPYNLYALDPSPALPSGLNFVSAFTYRWSVSGNENFPAVNFICAVGFPMISEIATSHTEVDRSTDFTLSAVLPIDDADSVRFWIFAPNGYLFADKAGTQSSHTFSPGKLQLLSAGDGYVRITAFNSALVEINGKKIQYINQAVTTRQIVIK